MSERGHRRPGVALLGTAADQGEASDWQRRLLEAGVHAVLRGHRENGSTERRPAFDGVDVYVPATQLAKARDVVSPIAADGQGLMADEKPFPWVWLFSVPVVIVAVLTIVTLVVL